MGSLAGPSLASQFLVHIKEFSILTSWPFWRQISFFRVPREGQIWQQWKLPGNFHFYPLLHPSIPTPKGMSLSCSQHPLLNASTLLARLMVISSEVHSGFVGEHLRVTCDPVQKQRNRTLKVPGVPEYYRKFTSRCSSPYPCQEVSLRNPRGSVSMLDNKTQSPMGASLELQNTCPI